MSDSSPVAHEGNPKEDSIIISGGDLLSTATLTIVTPFVPIPIVTPPEIPPGGGGGGDCISINQSTRNALSIAACKTSHGDGVVTTPGSYDFDPVYYGNACENYYGNFSFGMNTTNIGDNAAVPPTLYATTPSIFIPPAGVVALNSTCPALISRELIFNFKIPQSSPARNYFFVRPQTLQSDVINVDNLVNGAGIGDGSLPNPITAGGAFDCRFLFLTAGSEYYTRCNFEVAGVLNTPIGGCGLITTAGGATITGFGLVIDTLAGVAKLVRWDGASPDNFTVLASMPYSPAPGDTFELRVMMECPCPWTSLSPFYPLTGRVAGVVAPLVGDSTTMTSVEGLIGTAIQWMAIRHAAIMSMTVDNDEAMNLLAMREVTCGFVGSHQTC